MVVGIGDGNVDLVDNFVNDVLKDMVSIFDETTFLVGIAIGSMVDVAQVLPVDLMVYSEDPLISSVITIDGNLISGCCSSSVNRSKGCHLFHLT